MLVSLSSSSSLSSPCSHPDADYAERLLGCVAFILYDGSSPKNVQASILKFRARFGERVLGLGEREGGAGAGGAGGGTEGQGGGNGGGCGGDGSSAAATPARKLVWDGSGWQTRFAPHEIGPTLALHRITHCYIIKFGHPDEPSTRWYPRTGSNPGLATRSAPPAPCSD